MNKLDLIEDLPNGMKISFINFLFKVDYDNIYLGLLYNNLSLSESITEIKYKNHIKADENTKIHKNIVKKKLRFFSNCITIKIKNNKKIFPIKLFKNGKGMILNCQDQADFHIIFEIIKQIIFKNLGRNINLLNFEPCFIIYLLETEPIELKNMEQYKKHNSSLRFGISSNIYKIDGTNIIIFKNGKILIINPRNKEKLIKIYDAISPFLKIKKNNRIKNIDDLVIYI